MFYHLLPLWRPVCNLPDDGGRAALHVPVVLLVVDLRVDDDRLARDHDPLGQRQGQVEGGDGEDGVLDEWAAVGGHLLVLRFSTLRNQTFLIVALKTKLVT